MELLVSSPLSFAELGPGSGRIFRFLLLCFGTSITACLCFVNGSLEDSLSSSSDASGDPARERVSGGEVPREPVDLARRMSNTTFSDSSVLPEPEEGSATGTLMSS